MYIVFALLSAMAYGISSVAKHRSAQDLPATDSASRARGLWQLVVRSVRHPMWLIGIAADTVALGFQLLALHLGPIGVVQPLLIINLVFAFVVNRRGRLGARQFGWPVAVMLALGVLTVLAGTQGRPADPDVLPTVIGLALTGAVVVLGFGVSGRPLRRVPPALVLGVVVGVIYAAAAALLKALTDVATAHGLIGLIGAWQLYVVVVVGGAGLVLNQAAFQAGPLHQSLPAISAVDPVVSIGVGVLIYDERLRAGPLGVVVLVVVVAVLAFATVRLSRLESERPAATALRV